MTSGGQNIKINENKSYGFGVPIPYEIPFRSEKIQKSKCKINKI